VSILHPQPKDLSFGCNELTLHRIRQYRLRISQWKQDKNIKHAEMKAIIKRRQRRKLIEVKKDPLKFIIRGQEIDDQKINRFMKRYGIPDSLLYFPTPGAG